MPKKIPIGGKEPTQPKLRPVEKKTEPLPAEKVQVSTAPEAKTLPASPPPTIIPPVTVLEGSEPVPAAPARGMVTGYVTKLVRDKRLKIHKFQARASMTLYRWKGRAFFLDTSKAYLVGQKSAFLMYDLDVAEPLELERGHGQQSVHMPIVLDMNCHSSQKLEGLIRSQIFKQLAMAVRKPSEFNWMMILFLGLGIAVGFFAGQVFHLGGAPVP